MAAQPPPPPLKRKGASRRADIPAKILRQLNTGEIESATLAEMMALDFRVLLKQASPEAAEAAAAGGAALEPTTGFTLRMRNAGLALFEAHGATGFARFAAHRSDVVRGWSAYVLAATPGKNLAAKLRAVRRLADDPHSGVREWAWLALRGEIIAHLEEALAELMAWTAEPSPFLRRFASEATRPRGVWCEHIEALKRNPEPGLALLEPLRADAEKYVQDSVSNWLNDAAKSEPAWVEEVCARWRCESASPATLRIVKRALRSL